MLNKTYEAHPYTNNGRVVISYCAEMDVVVVKVHEQYKVIELDNLNELGILFEIQKVVNELC